LSPPLHQKGQPLGCRPETTLAGKQARILLDQVRTIDKKRLKKKMGVIPLSVWHKTLIQMLS
jgi:mRNA interferase MazF